MFTLWGARHITAVDNSQPTSTKHRARSAIVLPTQPVQSRIDFKTGPPFYALPDIIAEGFDALDRLFVNGGNMQQKIRNYYALARSLLTEHLRDPVLNPL